MANLNKLLNLDYDDDDDDESLNGFDTLYSYLLAYWVPSMVHSRRRTSGHEWVREILESRGSRCRQLFRMDVDVFRRFCCTLVAHHGLPPGTRRPVVSVEEMVAMFLLTVGHGVGKRVVQALFWRSPKTVGEVFDLVLQACLSLSSKNIKLSDPQFCQCHPKISNSHPHFYDAIGAIDRTHVRWVIRSDDEEVYPDLHKFTKNKYNHPTQHVLVVCDWDMHFTFMLAGWYGSVEDNRVLEHAKSRESLDFPHPPPGKYYLVDAAYFGPYRPPHQPRFIEANKTFNEYHSRLRLTIERTFGVWKNRFQVLNHMSSYKYRTQTNIVSAIMAIHNFIITNSDIDHYFQSSDSDHDEQPSVSTNNFCRNSESKMSHLRDRIRHEIHMQYRTIN